MRWSIVLWLPLVCCGARDESADLGADGGVCAALTAQATDFVAAHQSCNVDSDCTGEPAYGFIYDRGSRVSCWPALAISNDAAAGFLALMGQMFSAECDGPPGNTCSAWLPTPRCVQHQCTTG